MRCDNGARRRRAVPLCRLTLDTNEGDVALRHRPNDRDWQHFAPGAHLVRNKIGDVGASSIADARDERCLIEAINLKGTP